MFSFSFSFCFNNTTRILLKLFCWKKAAGKPTTRTSNNIPNYATHIVVSSSLMLIFWEKSSTLSFHTYIIYCIILLYEMKSWSKFHSALHYCCTGFSFFNLRFDPVTLTRMHYTWLKHGNNFTVFGSFSFIFLFGNYLHVITQRCVNHFSIEMLIAVVVLAVSFIWNNRFWL